MEPKLIDHKDEVDSTIAFLKTVINHDMDSNIWEWEFNSFPNDTILSILKDDKETVGTQFMLPVKLNVMGRQVVTAKCENTYFNSRFRGKGLFEKLFSFAEKISTEKEFEFLWAYTPATKVYEKKLDFTVLSDVMYNFTAVVGAPSMRIIKSYTSSIIKVYLKYFNHLRKRSIFKSKYHSFSKRTNYSLNLLQYSIVDISRSFDDIGKLYKELKSQHEDFVHIHFDKPYFDWRVKNNVNLNYITKFFYKGDDLVGYYILAIKDNAANIADFTALKLEVSNVMVCHLLNEIATLEVFRLNYFGNIENKLCSDTFNLLRNFGGKIQSADGMPFVFKNISRENRSDSDLQLPQNWYLNGMWTEGYSY